MRFDYPADPAWWDALCFRLSGPENVPVRRLMAGSPELPRVGFQALLRDPEPEVLSALGENPSLPPELALALLRHPLAGEAFGEDWFDQRLQEPSLSADDLVLIIEFGSWVGAEGAVLHANSDADVVEEFVHSGYRVDSPELAGRLLHRFPWGTAPQVWARIAEDGQWSRALLGCPETPTAFLAQVAREQWMAMERDPVWLYLHEISEEVCRHPNADAEVLDLLLQNDWFIEKDNGHDWPCLRLISEHPGASDRQRRLAFRQLEAQARAEEEEA